MMKLSFLMPNTGVFTNNKNWLWWVYAELTKTHEILLNDCDETCDYIVGMSISQIGNIQKFHEKFSKIPLVLYNWDWFSFIDKSKYPWPEFLQLMKESIDVWTCSTDTAKLCEKILKIPHHVIYCPAIPQEFEGDTEDDEFILMASRRASYKGWDIFEKGCEELNLKYISCHPSKFTRDQYIKNIKKCSLVVVASYEESNATMSSIEAAFCRKPLLLSDISANEECWRDCAVYFKTGNLIDFKEKLGWLFKNRNSEEIKKIVEKAYKKSITNYTPVAMSSKILERLYELQKI